MSKTVKTYTPKWAIVATWRRYRLFRTQKDAEERLRGWHDEREAAGMKVTGSMKTGYTARAEGSSMAVQRGLIAWGCAPVGIESARVVKLADHPICYIGVDSNSVCELRKLEEAEDPSFDRLSTHAKGLSEAWRNDEAL